MVVQYKCPDCGSDLSFDSSTGMLHCDSCGHNEPIDNLDTQGDSTIETEPNENWDNVHEHATFGHTDAKEYFCMNCGAMLYTDPDTTATTCSFCGAPVVLADRLQGHLAPAKVIPFSISKEQAQAAFKKWCKNGRFAPKDFKVADRIKSITGMYVPFFLYDLNGLGELNATCTKVSSFPKGDYIYTETKYYNVYRNVDLNYLKIPCDASEKMQDDMMDRLEPFDYSNLKDFEMPYLAGYIAEKYNYDDKALFPRVRKRAEEYVDRYMRDTIQGYDSTRINSEHINVQPKDTYYTLLPVWMVCYDYKDGEHNFAMNGQTGKIVGKPPISIKRVFTWFAGVSISSYAILQIISSILRKCLGGGWF